jgi:AcrR family transcriptional regulator
MVLAFGATGISLSIPVVIIPPVTVSGHLPSRFLYNEQYGFGVSAPMGRHREFDVERVLDAALRVFWQKGYEGSSFEDLTKATGIVRPSLYAAFGNKEALFRQALDRYDATYMCFANESLGERNSRAVVERLLRGFVDLHTRYPENTGCLGTNSALAGSDDAEPVRREIIHRREALEDRLRLRLERARKEGDLREACDSAALAAVVMTVAQGIAVQAKAGTTAAKLHQVVDHVLDTWPSMRD